MSSSPDWSRQLGSVTALSIARRRALLKGLVTGGTVAGTALPMGAHAAYYNGKWCTHKVTGNRHVAFVSGAQSVLLSLAPGNTNEVKGHRCSHYATSGNWPANCNNGYLLNFTCNTAFKSVFRCAATTTTNRSLLWLCQNAPTSAEASWACAIANAKKRVPFSYTQREVVDLYNDATRHSAALQFFRDFCESLA